MAILIGTSGFSYDDWRGPWYPPGLPKGEMLDFYASVFDTVEINATFYRVPPVDGARSMIERANGRLQFALKAPSALTHRTNAADGANEALDRFRLYLEPFAEAGVLAAILVQFPQSFHAGREEALEARDLFRAFESLPLAVEFRHCTWDEPKVDDWLGRLGVARVVVDQPDLGGLSESHRGILVPRRTAPAPLAYFRFHGRNGADWYSDESPHARYRYRYTAAEVGQLAEAVRIAKSGAKTTLAFFNNHPDGGAPSNAEELAGELGLTLRGNGHRDMFGG